MGCDYQYEDIQDLMIHVMENGGHLGGGKFLFFPFPSKNLFISTSYFSFEFLLHRDNTRQDFRID